MAQAKVARGFEPPTLRSRTDVRSPEFLSHSSRLAFVPNDRLTIGSRPLTCTQAGVHQVSERMRTAHLLVPAVLVLMGTAVFAPHGFLKRLLLPLRLLGDGVAQLSRRACQHAKSSIP